MVANYDIGVSITANANDLINEVNRAEKKLAELKRQAKQMGEAAVVAKTADTAAARAAKRVTKRSSKIPLEREKRIAVQYAKESVSLQTKANLAIAESDKSTIVQRVKDKGIARRKEYSAEKKLIKDELSTKRKIAAASKSIAAKVSGTEIDAIDKLTKKEKGLQTLKAGMSGLDEKNIKSKERESNIMNKANQKIEKANEKASKAQIKSFTKSYPKMKENMETYSLLGDRAQMASSNVVQATQNETQTISKRNRADQSAIKLRLKEADYIKDTSAFRAKSAQQIVNNIQRENAAYDANGKIIRANIKDSTKQGVILEDLGIKNQKVTTAWKKGNDAQKYTSALLRTNSKEWKSVSRYMDEAGISQNATTELAKTHFKTLTPNMKKELELRSKKIRQMRDMGIYSTGSAKIQEDALLRLNDAYNRHGTIIGRVRAGMQKWGERIHKFGMTFLTLLGPLFLVSAAIRTVKQAVEWATQPFIQFEDALYELRKTANLSIDEMNEMGEAITNLSLNTPIAAEELAKMAATAARLGIRGKEDILEFTKTISMMSVATTLSAEEAANSLAKIRQAFGIPIDSIETLGSVLNELENTTASTVEALVAGMENIGASAAMLGITEDAAAAMTATLIASGMAGQRAGTRLRRSFVEMAEKYDVIANQMGRSSEEVKRDIERNPTAALMDYLKFLNETESEIDRLTYAHAVFGQVGGFAIASLAQNYEALEENMETARKEMIYGTSLIEEYTKALTKTSAQLQILNNRSAQAKREIGEAFIPAVVTGKKIMLEFTEALASASKTAAIFNERTDDTIGSTNELVNEMHRLINEYEAGASTTEKFFTGFWFAADLLAKAAFGLDTSLDAARGYQAAIKEVSKENVTLIEKTKNTTTAFFEQALGINELHRTIKILNDDYQKLIDALVLSNQLDDVKRLLLRDIVDSLEERGIQLESVAAFENKVADSEGYRKQTLTAMTKAEEEGIDIGNDRLDLTYAQAMATNEMASAIAREITAQQVSGKYTVEEINWAHQYLAIKKAEEDELNNIVNSRGMENSLMQEGTTLHSDLITILEDEIDMDKSLTDQINEAGYAIEFINGELHLVKKSFLEEGGAVQFSEEMFEKYTDATYESAKATKKLTTNTTDLIIKYAQLTAAEKELILKTDQLGDTQRELFNSAENIGSAYESTTDALYGMRRAEDEMRQSTEMSDRLAKRNINSLAGMRNELESMSLDAISFYETGNVEEANNIIEEMSRKIPNMYREIGERSMNAKNEEERTGWDKTYDYTNDFVNWIKGQIIEIPGAEDAFDDSIEGIRILKTEIESFKTDTIDDLQNKINDLGSSIEDEIGRPVEDIMNDAREASKYIEAIPPEKKVSFKGDSTDMTTNFRKAIEDIETTTQVTIPIDFEWEETWRNILGKDIKIFGINDEEDNKIEPNQFGGKVYKTGLYQLEKGEEILTRGQTKYRESFNNPIVTIYNSFPNMMIRNNADVNKIANKIIDTVDKYMPNRLLR